MSSVFEKHDEPQMDIRYSWEIGSSLLIKSRSDNEWYNGLIVDIYIDGETNEEWFIVNYNHNKKKHIQRLSPFIKPLTRVESPLHDVKSPDLSVFDNSPLSTSHNCTNFTTCSSITRLITSLQHYTYLKPQGIKQNQSIFTQFMQKRYKYQVIDDFYHLTHRHNNDT